MLERNQGGIAMNEAIEQLKSICEGKENTEKVEISVLRLNRIIKALESTMNDSNKSDECD